MSAKAYDLWICMEHLNEHYVSRHRFDQLLAVLRGMAYRTESIWHDSCIELALNILFIHALGPRS